MQFDIWKSWNTSNAQLADCDRVVKLVASGIEAATFNEACEKAAKLPGVTDSVNYFTPGNSETGFLRQRPRLGFCRLFATEAEAKNPDGYKGK